MGMGVQLPRTLRTTTLVSRTVLLRITGPRRTYLTQAQKDREISGPIIHIPPPKSSNDIVKVSLIHYGRLLTKRASMSTNPNEPVEVQRRREKEEMKIPIFGALIEKDGKGHLWDLGLTKRPEDLPPAVKPFMDEVFSPIDMAPTVYATELLEAARRKRDIPFIDKIFISHAHADHFGDPTAFSQDVPIIYGPGTRAWLNSDSPILQFPRKYLETRDIHEVGSGAGYGPGEDKKWQKVGPFEQGWDYFGDGSLWLIPAPGHCIGSQVALCRVSTSPLSYVVLAGDAAHNQSLYAPVLPDETIGLLGKVRYPAEPVEMGATHVVYDDPDAAYDTLARLARLNKEDNVMTIAAHEYEMEMELGMVPGTISDDLGAWRERGLKEKKAKLHMAPFKD